MTRHYQQYIGGEFVDAISGNTLDSVNPATEQTIATFPAGDVQDVDRAVTSARKAFDDGP